eukprot:GHVR01024578.1.p1 GENE.GHVR01024578.1~~GHVR01024578.1.p1  ORF type:complete len:244 (+),score=80.93 GHVR01024578.1:44-775(+)
MFQLKVIIILLSIVISISHSYYSILGISKDATQDDIRKAYHTLALKWHPDKNKDNEDNAQRKFIEITEAYEALSNKDRNKDNNNNNNNNNDDNDNDCNFGGCNNNNNSNNYTQGDFFERANKIFEQFMKDNDYNMFHANMHHSSHQHAHGGTFASFWEGIDSNNQAQGGNTMQVSSSSVSESVETQTVNGRTLTKKIRREDTYINGRVSSKVEETWLGSDGIQHHRTLTYDNNNNTPTSIVEK